MGLFVYKLYRFTQIIPCLVLSSAAYAQVSAPRGFTTPNADKAPKVTASQTSSIPQARVGAGEAIPPEEAPPAANRSSNLGEAPAEEDGSPQFTLPTTPQTNQPGRFRTASGAVKVPDQLLDAFKDSVLRITALDSAGNKLNEAMGVAVGINDSGIQEGDSIYIATPLSVILGNSQEWADRIECTHDTGASYSAEVALVDERLGLVLLKPRNKPTPIRAVPENQERTQVSVITINFDRDRKNEIVPAYRRGILAAIDSAEGTLSVSGKEIYSSIPGTGIINLQGQLMGMLLPKGNGVLTSAIFKAIRQAKGRTTFPPRLLGVIMGRGVLVDPSTRGAYANVDAALKDIRLGVVPRADTSRYIQHVDPNNSGDSQIASTVKNLRPVLKIAAGTYKVTEPLEVPSNLSIAGAGPKDTIIEGENPEKPLFLLRGVKNVTLANLRLIAAKQQKEQDATIRVAESSQIVISGNVIEAKGGKAAAYILNSTDVEIVGNSFPGGKNKAIYCQNSTLRTEANSFLGAWPQALAFGLGCSGKATRNLFLNNEISIALSGSAKRAAVNNNTFVNDLVGVRLYGSIADLAIDENIFYTTRNSILSSPKINVAQVGRNTNYKSLAFEQDKAVQGLDFIKGKPEFRNQERYDFRLLPGSAGAGSGVPDAAGNPSDVGAFQGDDFVGEFTTQFLASLEAAVGEKNLAEAWGFKIVKEDQAQLGLPASAEPKSTTASKSAEKFPLEEE